MKSPHKGIARIIYAFKYSLDGLISAFKTESAFRQDILLCICALLIQFAIDVPIYSRVIMIFSLLFIIIAELINTAIETIIDRIGSEKHDLSKKAKDIGSAIVMLSIVWVAILWAVLIFI